MIGKKCEDCSSICNPDCWCQQSRLLVSVDRAMKTDTDAGDLELLLHHLTHYCNGYDIYYLENAVAKKDELERAMNKLKNLAALQGSTAQRGTVTISRECALVAQIVLGHARDEQTADVDGAYYDEIEQALEKEQ